jgi:hypothetical protein
MERVETRNNVLKTDNVCVRQKYIRLVHLTAVITRRGSNVTVIQTAPYFSSEVTKVTQHKPSAKTLISKSASKVN